MSKHIAIDQTFGSLLVLSRRGKNGEGEKRFLCQCRCGRELIRTLQQLDIRKMQRCVACHEQRVLKIKVLKERERKNKKHAHRKSARSKRTMQEAFQEQGQGFMRMPAEERSCTANIRS